LRETLKLSREKFGQILTAIAIFYTRGYPENKMPGTGLSWFVPGSVPKEKYMNQSEMNKLKEMIKFVKVNVVEKF
jgi:hypothetical protein